MYKGLIKKTFDSFCFGSSWSLTDQHLAQLIRHFKTPTTPSDSPLSGRTSVITDNLEGVGGVVVKHYTRGGIIRYLVKKRYLKWGKTRCQLEYEMLRKVRNLGVSVPEPIAYAYQGGLLYKAWLITREIKQHQTLAELSCINEERARIAMKEAVDQVTILIDNNIRHADLHPGNVLVDSSDRVFILDFDRAGVSRWDRNNLRDKYLMRWRRAVTKHGLPDMLSEMMSAGLRKNEEVE